METKLLSKDCNCIDVPMESKLLSNDSNCLDVPLETKLLPKDSAYIDVPMETKIMPKDSDCIDIPMETKLLLKDSNYIDIPMETKLLSKDSNYINVPMETKLQSKDSNSMEDSVDDTCDGDQAGIHCCSCICYGCCLRIASRTGTKMLLIMFQSMVKNMATRNKVMISAFIAVGLILVLKCNIRLAPLYLMSPSSIGGAAYAGRCPHDFNFHDGQCLHINTTHTLNWDDARIACAAMRARLLIPLDAYGFMNFIDTNYNDKKFWLGAHDHYTEGKWIWLNDEPLQSVFHWGYNQPDDWRNNEDCLMYPWHGGYNDWNCSGKLHYICEAYPTTYGGQQYQPCKTETDLSRQESKDLYQGHTEQYHTNGGNTIGHVANQPRPSSKKHLSNLGRCGGVNIGHQCLIFNDEPLSWDDAKMACEATGHRLASLADPHAVLTYAIGIYGGDGLGLWAGGSDAAKEGTWVWLNGEPFDEQFHWHAGMPDNYNGNEQCLAVNWRGGYNDGLCSNKKGYICESDYAWSAIRDACIKDNNFNKFTQVVTIDDCKEKCLSELGEDCQSIDYNPILHNCMISKARSDSEDYVEPCYHREVKYTETIHAAAVAGPTTMSIPPTSPTPMGAASSTNIAVQDLSNIQQQKYIEKNIQEQFQRNLCDPNPCPTSRVCVDKGNSYSCECLQGISDDDCKPHTQVCLPNPCENGGTCWIVAETHVFFCACRPGFTGNNCTSITQELPQD